MSRIVAYFVGGPNDLTKQVLTTLVPRVYFPQIDQDYQDYLAIQPPKPEEPLVCINHVYEYMARSRDEKIAIYQYVEKRQ